MNNFWGKFITGNLCTNHDILTFGRINFKKSGYNSLIKISFYKLLTCLESIVHEKNTIFDKVQLDDNAFPT